MIQIPGLLIVPKQLRTKPNLCWHLHWKRDENSPGLLSRFCALSPDEEEFFTKRRERSNQKVEDSEQSSAQNRAEADAQQGDVESVPAGERENKVKQDNRKHPKEPASHSQDDRDYQNDDPQTSTRIQRPPNPNIINSKSLTIPPSPSLFKPHNLPTHH